MKSMFSIFFFFSFIFCSCQSDQENKNKPVVINTTANQITETQHKQKVPGTSFFCKLNGVDWEGSGFYGSNLYYTKGMSQMYDNKPFLTLAFKANKLPDDRQLTISIINFKPETKVYHSKNMEAGLSGSSTGNPDKVEMQNNHYKGNYSSFTVNISSWSQVNQDEALISGTVEGTLIGLKMKYIDCCPDINIEKGVFNNVKVQLYRGNY